MGVWKKATTFRLDAEHEELITAVGLHFEPPSANASFNLRTLLNGIRAFLITGRMPRWMREMQQVHAVTVSADVSGCVQDSPTPGMSGQIGLPGVAGDAGRMPTIRSAKRSPRRFATRPKDRGAVAVEAVVAGGAWLAPFCGSDFRRSFATRIA